MPSQLGSLLDLPVDEADDDSSKTVVAPAAGQPPQRPVAPVQRPVAPPQAAAPAAPKPNATPVDDKQLSNSPMAWILQDAKQIIKDKLPKDEQEYEAASSIAETSNANFAQYVKDNPPLKKFVFDEAAPQAHEFTTKSTPWLMMLAAVGGKIGKISGIGMLKAQTGMLKGINEGNKENFDNAKNQWKEHYQMAVNEHQNAQEVYIANMKWRAGMAGADQAAAAAAAEHLGLDRKALGNDINAVNANEKILAGIKEHADRLEMLNKNLELRQMALENAQGRFNEKNELAKTDRRTKAYTAKETAEGTLGDLKEAYQQWENLKKNDPSIQEFIKQNSVLPIGIRDRLTKAGKDDYAKFAQTLASIKPETLAQQNLGLNARQTGIAAVEKSELNSLLSLDGKTPAMIDQAFKMLIGKATRARDIYKENWKEFGGTEEPATQSTSPTDSTPSVLDEADRILKGK